MLSLGVFLFTIVTRGDRIVMKVLKTFNNNIALVEDSFRQEMILMGKGIAFGKKGNQKVDLTNLNYKIFSCKNKNINNKLISITFAFIFVFFYTFATVATLTTTITATAFMFNFLYIDHPT